MEQFQETYIDENGVSRLNRRKSTGGDNCAIHESTMNTLIDHEARIRLLETLTTELREQNRTQFKILEEVKCGVDKLNTKQLAVAGAIILYLLTQLGPWG